MIQTVRDISTHLLMERKLLLPKSHFSSFCSVLGWVGNFTPIGPHSDSLRLMIRRLMFDITVYLIYWPEGLFHMGR